MYCELCEKEIKQLLKSDLFGEVLMCEPCHEEEMANSMPMVEALTANIGGE